MTFSDESGPSITATFAQIIDIFRHKVELRGIRFKDVVQYSFSRITVLSTAVRETMYSNHPRQEHLGDVRVGPTTIDLGEDGGYPI